MTFLVFPRHLLFSLRACLLALLLPFEEGVVPTLHHKSTMTRALREIPSIAYIIPIG